MILHSLASLDTISVGIYYIANTCLRHKMHNKVTINQLIWPINLKDFHNETIESINFTKCNIDCHRHNTVCEYYKEERQQCQYI